MTVSTYVDDLVLTGKKLDIISRLKNQLASTFEMTNFGILHFFIGLQVLPLLDGLFISQSKYVLDLLKCFNMDYCKAYVTPFQSDVKLTKDYESPQVETTLYQLVASLIYLTHSQPDISFDVSVMYCFMEDPRESH